MSLTDPVAKFIPAFTHLKVFVRRSATGMEVAELAQIITVKDLLAHTAGLTYDFLAPSPLREVYEQAGLFGAPPQFQLQVPVPELVRRVAELPLVCQPGQAWSYGVATDVVGHLVSLLADLPFATFVQERIFEATIAGDNISLALGLKPGYRQPNRLCVSIFGAKRGFPAEGIIRVAVL